MLPDEISFLVDFLNVPSVTGSEHASAMFLFQWMKRNLPHDVLELQNVINGRSNIVLRRGNPSLTLTSHLDTVPGGPHVRMASGRVYGRGSCDAKGQIVAQLSALKRMIKSGLSEYACFYVIGEEVDSIGARHLINHSSIGSEYLLNGEPTGNKFIHASAGILDFSLSTTAKKQHTSIPGFRSAIHDLVLDIHLLLNGKYGSSINVGYIQGGEALNVSTGTATAHISVRIQEDPALILRKIKKICLNASVKMLDPALKPFVFYVPPQYRENAIRVLFSSDSPLYAKKFKKIMMFGPGDILMAHADNEYISLSQMDEGLDIISQLLRKYDAN
jgi:acetylornithine deacetylase